MLQWVDYFDMEKNRVEQKEIIDFDKVRIADSPFILTRSHLQFKQHQLDWIAFMKNPTSVDSDRPPTYFRSYVIGGGHRREAQADLYNNGYQSDNGKVRERV